MNKENVSLYKSIARRSFDTKLNLYSFKMALNHEKEVVDIDPDRFKYFEITHELIEKYTAEYWQTERENVIYNKKVDDIYRWMKEFKEKNKEVIDTLKTNYILNFNQIFSENDFEYLLRENECYYCGITIDKVNQLVAKRKLFKKNERGWSLEIDRKNSNLEYKRDNCVMSCYWCNNAKTDEFTAEEFALIGKSIAKVWHDRLRESNIIGNFSDLKITKK